MAPKTKVKEKINIALKVNSSALERYAELDYQLKALKKEYEELKPHVREYLREQSHPLYTFSTSKKSVKIDPFKIYDWCKGKVPEEVLEGLATHSLAPAALDLLFLDKYINSEDIPEDCYEVSGGTETIKVKAPKE